MQGGCVKRSTVVAPMMVQYHAIPNAYTLMHCYRTIENIKIMRNLE